MTVRPAVLIRPHFYTTLSDRLASRPFLTHVEKLWVVYQLLHALDSMHGNVDKKRKPDPVVHGFLTTESVGLSSWNWVVLTDISSYKSRTALPDNDPSEYLYHIQELNQHRQGSDSTPREKRCYVAPERFYTPGQQTSQVPDERSTVSTLGQSNDLSANLSLTSPSDLHDASDISLLSGSDTKPNESSVPTRGQTHLDQNSL